MAQGFQIVPKAQESSALSTYTRDASTKVYTYLTARTGGGATTRDLQIRVYYPTGGGFNADVPRPCVMYLNHGLFLTSDIIDDTTLKARADFAVTHGVMLAAFETRASEDTPITPVSDTTHSATDDMTRAINASIEDTLTAYHFIRALHGTASEFSIEPNWIFLSGSSSGGIQPLLSMVRYGASGAAMAAVVGLIIIRSAFAADGVTSPSSATTAIRVDLEGGKDESDYVSSLPPVCSFNNDDDAVISPTHITALDTQLDAGHADNVQHRNATGGHQEWEDFTLAGLISAASIVEAWKDFIDSRTGSISRFTSVVGFS